MFTERVPVADGVALAVDVWVPNPVVADPGLPPFVLAHGLASNARIWDGVAERLAAAGHVTVTVDLRGHGRSSKPNDAYDMPTVADDLAAVIHGLGLERPVVAGQSWGGNVVVELAARHAGALRGIVGVDGGWLEPSRRFESWEACRDALQPPRLVGRPFVEIEGRIRSAHPDWPETGIRGTLANFEVRPDGTVAPWLTFERHIAVLRGLWEHHPSERFPLVTIPVLLAPADDGDTDRTARKRRDVDAALSALPNARVRWFPGDHDVHAQHPAELAAAMRELAGEAPTENGRPTPE